MGFPPLGTAPLLGFSPFEVSPSADGISPLEGLVCTLRDGISLGDGNTDLPTGSFSISLRESNPPLWGFFPLGVPTVLQRFSFSELPFDVLLMRFFPLRNTNTSLRALLTRPTGG